jgi:hypothetical protein
MLLLRPHTSRARHAGNCPRHDHGSDAPQGGASRSRCLTHSACVRSTFADEEGDPVASSAAVTRAEQCFPFSWVGSYRTIYSPPVARQRQLAQHDRSEATRWEYSTYVAGLNPGLSWHILTRDAECQAYICTYSIKDNIRPSNLLQSLSARMAALLHDRCIIATTK